jgi:hypothetical protein
MTSDIANNFGYTSISGSGIRGAPIDGDKVSLSMRLLLADDLIQTDTMDIQTSPKRITICHIPHGDPKNVLVISDGTYAGSEHVREYSDYLRPTIFPKQHS